MKKTVLALLLLTSTTLFSCELVSTNSSLESPLSLVSSDSSDSTTSSSNSTSSLDSSSTSNNEGIYPKPVENKDDGSTLITTSTLIKLPVPEVTSDTYTIPNSNITITRGEVVTDMNEVAAYLIAFKERPVNYYYKDDKTTCNTTYGEDCRLYGSETYSNEIDDHHTSPYLSDGATNYYELDLGDYEGNYNYRSRGAYRLVYSLDEGHEIVYYTDCHYENFAEYYNYYNGFGPWFGNGDVNQNFQQYPNTISHPEPASYIAPEVGQLDFSVYYPQD